MPAPSPQHHALGRLEPADANWPASLRSARQAPEVLYFQGNLELLHAPCVAVVGARRCTGNGRELSATFARALADAGGVVVSGLAAGIDAEAHAAAGGRTIAVLPQGLEAQAAVWQAKLREQILDEGGLLVTEYAGAHPAAPWTFARRNQIIAGLSRAVVVVEAARRSGSKITARHARAMNKPVAAVPGPPGDEAYEGCVDLVNTGATRIYGLMDVLALLP